MADRPFRDYSEAELIELRRKSKMEAQAADRRVIEFVKGFAGSDLLRDPDYQRIGDQRQSILKMQRQIGEEFEARRQERGSWSKRLFARKGSRPAAPVISSSPATTSQGGTTGPSAVVDLRSSEEREMAARSQSEHERVMQSLGAADLASELISLVNEDNSGFANSARIREIGEELYRRGGYSLVQEAYYHVTSAKIYFSQDIWDGIGEWQA